MSMKKNYLSLVLLLFIIFSNAQEFAFPIYFEDAAGYKDTLVLGYDITATDSVDIAFDEINIISEPLNDELDVRVSNAFFRGYGELPATYHTKKQIIKNSCGYGFPVYPVICIDIKSNHWPVNVMWDSTLFVDTCVAESQFASFLYWSWDITWPNDFNLYLNQQSSQIAKTESDPSDDLTYYINDSGDTIRVFFIVLDDEQYTENIESHEVFDFKIFNNKEILTVSSDQFVIGKIEILDLAGKTVIVENAKAISIAGLPEGLYLCRVYVSSGIIKTFKFIK